MKLSQIFREAKYELWNGFGQPYQPKFVCHAINRLFARHPLHDDRIYAAKHVISELLNGHTTLEDWLVANKHCRMEDLYMINGNFRDPKKIQATRHAWLNHLIQHYESIGN